VGRAGVPGSGGEEGDPDDDVVAHLGAGVGPPRSFQIRTTSPSAMPRSAASVRLSTTGSLPAILDSVLTPEAWQRPDTVVVNEPWWTPTARMADIVLPATTTLERDDISAGSREAYVVAMKRAFAPQGQARNDREIFAALAERLGCREDYTDGHDEWQALRAMYERARASAAEHGHVLPDFATFWERGYHR